MKLWSKSDKLNLTPAVLLAAVLFIVSACREEEPPRGLVYSCAAYTITADSIITPQIRISATDLPKPYSLPSGEFTSISFGGSPMLSRLCALGMERIALGDTTPVEPAPGKICSYWLAGALVAPHRSIVRLREMLGSDGLPRFRSGEYEWPVAGGRSLWTIAAYEAYCATADSAWLREIAAVTDRMLALDIPLALREDIGMLRGGMCVPSLHSPALYPRWVDAVGRYESMTLSVNAITIGALQRQAAIHEAIGDAAPGALSMADAISSAVNDRLWIPNRSLYSQYLYGGAFPLQSPATDNFGQAVAVLFDIPTPEMATALLTRTPMVAGGPSVTFPSTVGTPPFNGSESWPATQALWAMAAARRGHASALAFTLGALMHDASLGSASGAASAALAVVAMRVLAGITLTAEAMEFHPMILPALDGGVRVERLPYRDATLTVEISGFGSRIARFTIDGVETSDYRVPSGLTGHHTVEITLANNQLQAGDLPVVPQAWLLPVPELEWSNPLSARIADSSPTGGYWIWLDGVSGEEITGPAVNLSPQPRLTAINLTAISGDREGYASKTRLFIPRGAVTTLQAEEFAPGGTSFIRGSKLSQRFVETSSEGRARFPLELIEPEPTDVLIDVCYSNGNGPADSGAACAVRRLSVNGTPCGSFVMPGRGDGWWVSTGFSNMLRASLSPGSNIIELTAEGPGGDVPVLIDFVRIYRLRPFPVPHEKDRNYK